MMMSWMKRLQQRQSRRRIAEPLLVTVDFVELDGLKKMTWLHCYSRFISSKQCNAFMNAEVAIHSMTKKKEEDEIKKSDRRKWGLFDRAEGPPSFSRRSSSLKKNSEDLD